MPPEIHTRCLFAGTVLRSVVGLTIGMVMVAALVACAPPSSDPSQADIPGPAGPPEETNLSDPLAAVRSYTAWITYAYRVNDSDVAAHAMSVWEEVRVNSYVQYNLLEGRAIDQRLVDSDYTVAEQSETTATVTGEERWVYRYTTADGTAFTSPEYEVSYDVTYTVIVEDPKGWVVYAVQPTARDEVK